MGKFGWSLPPGCTHAMIDEACGVYDGPCECCGELVDNCICPECPECNSYGDPHCYKEHGLEFTQQQLDGQKKLQEYYEAEAEADRKMAEAMARDYEEEKRLEKEWLEGMTEE